MEMIGNFHKVNAEQAAALNRYDPVNAKVQSGFKCSNPYEFVAKGRAEVWLSPCRRCERCIAADKMKMAGQLVAEAILAPEIDILTLTYASLEPWPKAARSKKNPKPTRKGCLYAGDRRLAWVQPRQRGARVFVSEHRSKCLDALRQQLFRNTVQRLGYVERDLTDEQKAHVKDETPRFTYFGVGEEGSKNFRKHWHVVLFFDRPSGLRVSEITKKKNGSLNYERLNVSWWPYGHITNDQIVRQRVIKEPIRNCPGLVTERVEEYPMPRLIKRVLYAVKYLAKARGVTLRDRKIGFQPKAVFFRSTGRPLGAPWILEQAREYARAGLPYHGNFTVSGLFKSVKSGVVGGERVNLARELSDFSVKGVTAKYALAAYKDEWTSRTPDRQIPLTDFLRYRDPDFAEVRIDGEESEYRLPEVKPMEWAEHGQRAVALPPYRQKSREALIPVDVVGKGNIGVLRIYDTGVARWVPMDFTQRPCFVREDRWEHVFSMLDERSRNYLTSKVAAYRGSGWLSPSARKAELNRRILARETALLTFAKRELKATLAHVNGVEPMTGILRKLSLWGAGYHKAVSRHVAGSKLELNAVGVLSGWLGKAT